VCGAYGNQDCTNISLCNENNREADAPVRRRVLLRHAYVTIIIGPRYLWNRAMDQNLSMTHFTIHIHGNNPLDSWNPVASRPKNRSSIHQEISLTKQSAGARAAECEFYPTVKLSIVSLFSVPWRDLICSLTVHGSLRV
jgi:hypothetical protein